MQTTDQRFRETDTLITWKQLEKLVPYSRSHVWRLEKEGKFPTRITLGANRTVWIHREIVEYINRKSPVLH